MPVKELSKDFNKEYYLQINPDVAAAGVDPVTHYLQYGYNEGCTYKPVSILLQVKLGSAVFNHDGLTSMHNHDFMIDPVYKAAYARGVQAAAGHDYQWYWRMHISLWAASTASKLPGDFVECGVNRGFLSSAIMQQLNWDSTGRMFYLLDTFQGIVERYLSDIEIEAGVTDRNRRDINSKFYTENFQEVEHNFAEWRNKKMVVGSIPDTLTEIKSEKIAFLHIDMNCTEPEVAALNYLWGRLVTGGLVLLDDYAYIGYQPQKEGMDAWAAKHDVAIASLPTGQGLIIKT